MIGQHAPVPVYAYGAPADLRKGFEGLSGLVQTGLGQDPLSGALYLFTNQRRTHAKVLYFDGTGLVLLTKRLFKGRFARPWVQQGAPSVELTVAELSLFLEGCELAGRWKLSPPAFEEKELAVAHAV